MRVGRKLRMVERKAGKRPARDSAAMRRHFQIWKYVGRLEHWAQRLCLHERESLIKTD
ncbi:hypothetical protein PHLCEN_2v12699 [Hermanssonia centrifuga]|uniref:Uncharacterized protein n=1 Tax=Hermanssonia centrifuga TaxID=98765 RepID=A0A2R6NHG5_9APHY|nr:hypothetical protein PHLCEN_2v12699 [Hermanssonia centrifuga]